MKQGEKYDEKRVRERHRDHALFIAFAPADNPKIALGDAGRERRPRRLDRGADRARRCSTTTCSARCPASQLDPMPTPTEADE